MNFAEDEEFDLPEDIGSAELWDMLMESDLPGEPVFPNLFDKVKKEVMGLEEDEQPCFADSGGNPVPVSIYKEFPIETDDVIHQYVRDLVTTPDCWLWN